MYVCVYTYMFYIYFHKYFHINIPASKPSAIGDIKSFHDCKGYLCCLPLTYQPLTHLPCTTLPFSFLAQPAETKGVLLLKETTAVLF